MIELTIADGVAEVVLNAPEKLNALDHRRSSSLFVGTSPLRKPGTSVLRYSGTPVLRYSFSGRTLSQDGKRRWDTVPVMAAMP